MRHDQRALEGLPLKLLIVLLMISLSLPLFLSTFDAFEKSTSIEKAKGEAERILFAATLAFMDGPGSSRAVSVEVPHGSIIIAVGGSLEELDSRSVRLMIGGEVIYRCYPEINALRVSTAIGSPLVIESSCRLLLQCVESGENTTWVMAGVVG